MEYIAEFWPVLLLLALIVGALVDWATRAARADRRELLGEDSED